MTSQKEMMILLEKWCGFYDLSYRQLLLFMPLQDLDENITKKEVPGYSMVLSVMDWKCTHDLEVLTLNASLMKPCDS